VKAIPTVSPSATSPSASIPHPNTHDSREISLFLLFLLAVITFLPLCHGGFTTHDDGSMAIKVWNGNTWAMTTGLAADEGRVGFLWGIPLLSVPFIFHSWTWYLVAKIGSTLLLLVTIFFVIARLFGSRWIGLASVTLFLAIIQNGWEHNALTSYAFVFNAYAILFLLSLGLFCEAIDRKNLFLAWSAGVCYFGALGSELFALFFPIYVVVLSDRMSPNDTLVARLQKGKLYLLAIAMPLAAYIVLYLVWRYLHPSSYEGTAITGFHPWEAIRVIVTYSLAAFPLASLHLYTAPNDPLPFIESANWRTMLSNMNAAHLIKPLLVGVLITRLLNTSPLAGPPPRTLLIGAALAFVSIFIPNVLLGFTDRHPNWVGGGTHSYIYTYYSFIAAIVFLSLLLFYAQTRMRTWPAALRAITVVTLVAAIMIASFAVEVRNQYFAFDQKLAHRKWQLMDEVIDSPTFRSIPSGSTIYAPTLLSHTRGYAVVLADDWARYVRSRLGVTISFDKKPCATPASCYTLVYRQEPNADSQFVVLKKPIQPAGPDAVDLTIWSMPSLAGAVVLGSLSPKDVKPEIRIDGTPVDHIGSGVFSSQIPQAKDGGLVEVVHVTGNVDIPADDITVSRYNIQPRLRPLLDELADGIDFTRRALPSFVTDVTGLSDYEPPGRWTDATNGDVTSIGFSQPLPRVFALEISAFAYGPNIGAPVKVRVGNSERIFVIPGGDKALSRLTFETDGAVSTLEIIAPHPTSPKDIDPASRDPRKLGIRLVSLRIVTAASTATHSQ
jgi:hypothetical protein